MFSLAIDGNEANVGNRVGSNVYAFEIVTHLYDLARPQPDISVTVLLSRQPLSDMPPATDRWHYKVIAPTFLWTQWALPIHLYLNQEKYDVIFTPGHYAPRISSIPSVCSVMDLAFLRFPEQFKKRDLLQLKHWTKYSVKQAKKVITISEFSKQDIITTYKKKSEDVVVAYPAISPPELITASTVSKTLKQFHLKQPYLVYVGTIQPRKNLTTLIEAYESVRRSMSASVVKKKLKGTSTKLQLVIAGKIGWLATEFLDRVAASPFKKDIIVTGFVTQQQKQILLSQAQASVLIGLYEGFGIPPLESLAVGTVPIVSKTSSLPEVVGKAGLLVDPTNVSEIAEAIKKTLNLKNKEKILFRRLARKQIEKFNWTTSAQVILDTLRSVAKK